MQLIRPFGPIVAKVTIPKDIVDSLNKYVDEIIINESKSKELDYEVPFIMISGHGDLDTAVECIKNGAYDYISKPPDLNRLLTAVRNGLNISNLENTNKILKNKIKTYSCN